MFDLFKPRAVALAAALLASPALAHHAGDIFQAGDMVVSHAWTQETSGTSHAIEVFVTVSNEGSNADRLIGATTSFTNRGVFQAPVLNASGSLAVTEVPALEIAPGQSITLQPGGIRVVLPNVQREYGAGSHFHMTLEFETAGMVEIDVKVDEAAHEHEHHDGEHDHDHDHRTGS
jgi:periplasmic copper chaperone A